MDLASFTYLLNLKEQTVFGLQKDYLQAYDNCDPINIGKHIAIKYDIKNNIFEKIENKEICQFLKGIEFDRGRNYWIEQGIRSFTWSDNLINALESYINDTDRSTH